MTKLAVCNMALDFLEMDPIPSLTATTNNVVLKVLRAYDSAAEYVLTRHDWQEAITWATLETEATDSYTSAGSGNTSGATVFAMSSTIAAATPQKGDLYTGTYTISYTSWADSTFVTEGLPATLQTQAVTVTPNFWDDIWEYMYDLPSDCLKVISLEGNGDIDFIIEGAYVYTNEYDSDYGIKLQYVKDIREESNGAVLYSDVCAEAIAARLAYLIAPASRKREMRLIFEDAFQDIVGIDSREKRNPGAEGVDWWDE